MPDSSNLIAGADDGGFQINLSESDGQATLTVKWFNKSTPQEGISTLTATLGRTLAQLGLPALNLQGQSQVNYGVETRPQSGPVAVFTPGGTGSSGETTNDTLTIRFKSRAENVLTSAGANMDTITYGRADYIHGTEFTEEWRATWLRAVALCWADTTNELSSSLMADPFTFLQKYCNYTLPPTVELVVLPHAEGAVFNPSNNTPNWTWQLPRTIVVMFVPPRPADANQQAVALAAYEAVGKQYPFTVTS